MSLKEFFDPVPKNLNHNPQKQRNKHKQVGKTSTNANFQKCTFELAETLVCIAKQRPKKALFVLVM